MSSVEILVPDLPESVADATVATWHKKPGDTVARDEVIVEIETDKVVLEVPAPEAGIMDAILEEEGATVLSRQLLGRLRPADVSGKPIFFAELVGYMSVHQKQQQDLVNDALNVE